MRGCRGAKHLIDEGGRVAHGEELAERVLIESAGESQQDVRFVDPPDLENGSHFRMPQTSRVVGDQPLHVLHRGMHLFPGAPFHGFAYGFGDGEIGIVAERIERAARNQRTRSIANRSKNSGSGDQSRR